MVYNFGQYRQSQDTDYVTKLGYNKTDWYPVSVEMPDDTSTKNKDFKFYDTALSLETPIVNNKNSMNSYYIRFTVKKMENETQTFTLRLVNDEISQKIEVFTVDKGTETSSYEFIITPSDNHSFDTIHFELHRGLTDYTKEDVDEKTGIEYNGRKPEIEIESLQQVINIIERTGHTQLKQLGIQGPPGLLMSINGEQIRIGRSGLYEITNGTQIDFLGFVIEENENKYFILDYQY